MAGTPACAGVAATRPTTETHRLLIVMRGLDPRSPTRSTQTRKERPRRSPRGERNDSWMCLRYKMRGHHKGCHDPETGHTRAPRANGPIGRPRSRAPVIRQPESIRDNWIEVYGSIIAAQASVGVAATWPTTGTTSSTAEVSRQGNAAAPQPVSAMQAVRRARSRIVMPSYVGTAVSST